MSPSDRVDEKLDPRRYLLGDADEDGIAEFEVRLLGDQDLADAVEAVEEALIDQAARGTLSPRDQALFDRNFLTPERQREVELTRFLREQAAARPVGGQAAAESRPFPPSELRAHRSAPAVSPWALAVAAAAVVALGAGWMLASERARQRYEGQLQSAEAERQQERDDARRVREQQQTQLAKLQQELALATGGLGPLISIDARVRAGEPSDVQLDPQAPAVRLSFAVPAGQHAGYRVTLLAVQAGGAREVWTADVPAAVQDDARPRAVVQVPRVVLAPGRYLAQVSGRHPDDDDAAEFGFVVR